MGGAAKQPSFANQRPAAKMVGGKLVPSPEEYEEVGFNLRESLYYFVMFYFCFFLPILALHQETVNPGATVNKWIR